jgi:hypothetical protein
VSWNHCAQAWLPPKCAQSQSVAAQAGTVKPPGVGDASGGGGVGVGVGIGVGSADGRGVGGGAARTIFGREFTSGSEIFIMDADGANLTRLTETPEDEGGLILSPDGRQVLFSADLDPAADERDELTNVEIFVMNLDGSGRTRLTHQVGFDAAWDWR